MSSSDKFIGEIYIFPYNFAPKGWAFCNGQILAIAQNTTLFALLGTTYGGDGKTTFALPDLGGRVPMHPGENGYLGEKLGENKVILTNNQLPTHQHTIDLKLPTATTADTQNPTKAFVAKTTDNLYSTTALAAKETVDANHVHMNAANVSAVGGGQSHNNMQPYLALSFCIALTGTFPQRP